MEGFNNIIRQAYGFWDDEYFKIKIFGLPDVRTGKYLCL
jgi:hypothetical protein